MLVPGFGSRGAAPSRLASHVAACAQAAFGRATRAPHAVQNFALSCSCAPHFVQNIGYPSFLGAIFVEPIISKSQQRNRDANRVKIDAFVESPFSFLGAIHDLMRAIVGHSRAGFSSAEANRCIARCSPEAPGGNAGRFSNKYASRACVPCRVRCRALRRFLLA